MTPADHTSDETVRAEFELWARSQGDLPWGGFNLNWSIELDRYYSEVTQSAWLSWQCAMREYRARQPVEDGWRTSAKIASTFAADIRHKAVVSGAKGHDLRVLSEMAEGL